MFSKQKSWLSGTLWKPKNPHSLEHLKFLYNVLCKNQTVTEQNRGLLVETLRSISEILIWGDQNDSSVFDFFLEKNMLSFFLRYLQQKFGRFICVQLLQTLNILFENIRNETSLYYLLSNNHVNSIIVHKFDFSDEEVMAYYISFLKTLSLKLNKHTIHFFYNEIPAKFQPKAMGYQHTNDFALYTEAIKFFNHSESMVRIAVRTITLNVFKVDDKAMLSYIRDRTASPYFSNLVWFIGNHILDLDACVRHDHDHRSRDRLADLVAEHLDHLHYLNDIFLIHIDTLNLVLTDKLLNRLLVPLYVYSLTKRRRLPDQADDRKHVSCVVSLFLLSQVFLIIHYSPLMQQLAEVIFQGDASLSVGSKASPNMGIREFRPPRESLEKTLENAKPKRNYDQGQEAGGSKGKGNQRKEGLGTEEEASGVGAVADGTSTPSTEDALSPSSEMCAGDLELSSPTQNSTDEEKLMGRSYQQRLSSPHLAPPASEEPQLMFTLENRPYLEAIFNALECSENDYSALFALCLLYAMGQNEGISQSLLDTVLMPTDKSETKENYNLLLVERLIRLIELACQSGSKVRLATLEISIKLLRQLVMKGDQSYLQDRHLACVANAREGCTQLLRSFYKSEEIFLDMFEDEYREMKTRPLNVEYLMQDASILLPPTGTPLTGIDFNRRLPCGEVERARRAIRVFFLIRDLSLSLLQEKETQLPLTKEEMCIKEEEVLDLNNSDLIACTVVNRESRRQERRFLVIDPVQLILVEPDSKRLGWGVVKFVGYLQDVEVSGDKDDSRILHVVVHRPQASVHARPIPLLSARFVFDDHIRCMAAKQRLMKGRQKARQHKMATLERLLDISHASLGANYHPLRTTPIPGRSHPVMTVKVERSSSSSNASQSSQQSQGHAMVLASQSTPTTQVLVQTPPSASVSSTSSSLSTSSTGTTTTTTATPIGSKSGRKVKPEQRRLLQAKAAQRSRSRQEQQLKEREKASGSTDATSQADSSKGEIDQDDEIELAEDARSAEAFISLNNLAASDNMQHSTPHSSSSLSAGRRSSFGQDAKVGSTSIPLENLATYKGISVKSVPHTTSNTEDISSLSKKTPQGLARITGGIRGFMAGKGGIAHFQRSASLSPTRGKVAGVGREVAQASTNFSSEGSRVRRSSLPPQNMSEATSNNDGVDRREVAVQVSQVKPVIWRSSRSHSRSSPPDPGNVATSTNPAVSLVSAAAFDQSAPCPVLLPPGPSPHGGHMSKQSTVVVKSNCDIQIDPDGMLRGEDGAVGAVCDDEAVAPLTTQRLSLHLLQQQGGAGSVGGGGPMVSPETPSSDASMLSVSSVAGSEASSMDVDSDNGSAGGGGGAVGGRNASQQLTQLAQMVQEHYPYKPGGSGANQQHTG